MAAERPTNKQSITVFPYFSFFFALGINHLIPISTTTTMQNKRKTNNENKPLGACK
jgi:hypothetical protein